MNIPRLLQRSASLASVLMLSSCAAPASQICSGNDLNLWRVAAIRAIRTQVRYPREAIIKKLEGTVRVNLSVSADGELVQATVAQSSGFAILDEAALAAVWRTTLPAPKCSAQAHPMSHTIPMIFNMEDLLGAADPVQDWVDRVRAKIRSNLSMPQGTPPDIEASFEVDQLPTGEILSVRMLKSSGFRPYDEATERAILRSSPLPTPATPAFFQRKLMLSFRP